MQKVKDDLRTKVCQYCKAREDLKAKAPTPTQNYKINHDSNEENYKKIIADYQAKNEGL